MKGLTIILAGVFSFPSIQIPPPALEVPAVCEALDPRMPEPFEQREMAIATAKQQYQAGQTEAAIQTVDALWQQIQRESVEGWQDITAIDQLEIAEAYIDIQHPEPAFELLEAVLLDTTESFYNHPYYVWRLIAALYARAGEFERAWELVAATPPREPPVTIDFAERQSGESSVRENIVRFHLANHDFEQAQMFVDGMQSERLWRDRQFGQAQLVNYQIAQGDLEQALLLAQDIEDNEHRWTAFLAIGKTYKAIGQTEQTVQLIDSITAEGLQTEIDEYSYYPRFQILLEVSQLYIELGKQNSIFKILETVLSEVDITESSGGKHYLLVNIAYLYFRINALEEARSTLKLAHEASQDLDSFELDGAEIYYPDALAQLDLALLYWELGELKQAQQLLETALGRSVQFQAHAGADQRYEFVDYLIRTEQFKEAIKLSWTIEAPRSRHDILVHLIEKALSVGEDRWAMNAAQQIEHISEHHRYQVWQLEQNLTDLSQFLEQGQYDRAERRVIRWQGEQHELKEKMKMESDRWLAFIDCFQQANAQRGEL
ncbi:MAG: hypothetical protein F6J87_22380 [Spirulina sp. SIO3F2]|nr:hypothetical protein [Spirulina sp. SIO3F2]